MNPRKKSRIAVYLNVSFKNHNSPCVNLCFCNIAYNSWLVKSGAAAHKTPIPMILFGMGLEIK
jgi:hypothetical protein